MVFGVLGALVVEPEKELEEVVAHLDMELADEVHELIEMVEEEAEASLEEALLDAEIEGVAVAVVAAVASW